MSQVETKTRTRVELTEPPQYKIILLNDDFTPMSFVVELLVVVFGHSLNAAKDITMAVHNEGAGVAGVYFWEMAEQKHYEAERLISTEEQPLKMKIEKM